MLPFHSSQVASDFSNYQLSKLMQRSRTSQKLADVRKVLRSSETAVIGLSEESKVHEVEASRIMSSDSAHYILVKGRELESSSQEDSLSQSSMELPAIGESESDMDRRREEEEEEEQMVKKKVVEEEKEEEEEEEERTVTEFAWSVVESKPHKGEGTVRATCELLESAATACKPSVATSEEREEASHALAQETDRSNLPVKPAASVVSEIKAIPRESSSPTVSVMAIVSERETTPRENCSLTSVVASASEMQATPREEEKSSLMAHVSTSEGVPSSQPCEKLRGVKEVLRDGSSFVEDSVEEERRLHLEEQLEREGEEKKEGKEEEGKEERVKEEEEKREKEERGKEDGGKEEGGKEGGGKEVGRKEGGRKGGGRNGGGRKGGGREEGRENRGVEGRQT